MPLKSRATQARAERAESDLDKSVQPRAGADLSPPKRDPEPPAPAAETAAAAPAPPAAPKAPRKPRTVKPASTTSTPITPAGELDKKAVRARLTEIEKAFKSLAGEEKVAMRTLVNDFAARGDALKKEHAELSAKLSAAAFGQ